MAEAAVNGSGNGAFFDQSQIERMRMMADTLTNVLSGLGGSGDKTAFARHVMPLLAFDRSQLEIMYRGDWIARKAVDLPAQDSTREWRGWQADSGDTTAIEDVEKKFKIQYKTSRAMSRGRLYGGAALVLGVDGDPATPLEVEKVKKGDLKFVHVVNRHDLTSGPIETDIMSDFFGQPRYYERSVPKVVRIHPSRIIRMLGNELPDPLNTPIGDASGWSDSILTTVNDAMIAAGLVAGSGATLVQEMNYDVIKIPQLSNRVTTKEYENQLIKRFQVAANAKGVVKSILLDKEEEWNRISTSLTGLPDTVKLYLLIASAAVDIPATRFLSQSPTGLTATGESDMRNYYDRLSSDQSNSLTPALDVLDEVMIRSALGAMPDGIYYEWNPLWQLDDLQNAQRDYQRAQTWQIDVNSGLLNEDVLRKARYNQVIEDGTYPGIEDAIDEFGEEPPEPDLPPPPVPGQPAAPPAPGTPPAPAANANQPPAPQPAAATADFDRMRKSVNKLLTRDAARRFGKKKRGVRVEDAQPRTLYLRRDVTNGAEILAHFRAQGVENLLPADQLHVTIAYSRQPLDWMKISPTCWGEDTDGTMHVVPGGIRMVEPLGQPSIVALLFASSALSWRHADVCQAGASFDYDQYQPHVTVAGPGMSDEDIRALEAWQGPIELGPEIAEEIDSNFSYGGSREDAIPFGDDNPNHDPETGEFTSGPGGGGGGKEDPLKKLEEKHGKPVATEGHTRGYATGRHGEPYKTLQGTEVKRTELQLYRGTKNPKEFGKVTSSFENPSSRGSGGGQASHAREETRYKLSIPGRPESKHGSVKEAMKAAEAYRAKK